MKYSREKCEMRRHHDNNRERCEGKARRKYFSFRLCHLCVFIYWQIKLAENLKGGLHETEVQAWSR